MSGRESKLHGPVENIDKILEIESKWAERWVIDKIYAGDMREGVDKIFITFPYAYMNGSLHLGHAFSSGRLDVLARYYRMKGYNVLYPWAWHWTGEAVFGTIHRLIDGDESIKRRLIELDGVDENIINNLTDPVFFVKYFTDRNREAVKRYGLSLDWRREFHTTSLHPLYNKFIEWQIRKLFKRGFIGKGRYPAVWCPRDRSPTGDHDRLEGVGVRPEEYTLIKFTLYMNGEEIYLVAGTFRPETIFGATNIWVKPDGKYVLAMVDGEKWIISKEASFKLSNQLKKVSVLEEFNGNELIGLYVKTPIIGRYIPILPANFVDTDIVSGIVYSVPAHAPYDYLALRDIWQGDKTDLSIKMIAEYIKPISIISVEGYGDYPAIDIVKKMEISTQLDFDKADKATQEIYRIEYHKGVMRNNCGPISGLPVKEAKEIIRSILIDEGMASSMYDLPEKVICRCGTKCIVKILEDQWYLRYSDYEWKKLAHKAIDNMSFYPPEVKKQFHYYVDWYEDWPCTRKTGLGTPFPFDRSWIVETLTDSTIYMAFYIIAKYYNEGLIKADKIKDSFFDYILLGEGDVNKVSVENSIDINILESIKNEFNYWYPVDIRGSGKDLVGNHLTFYIFHHVAIFPMDKWPRSISVNGFVILNGMEMSKSKGNYISIEDAIKLVGADALRLSLLILADGLDDPDWSIDKGKKAVNKIRAIYKLIKNINNLNIGSCDKIDFYEEVLLSQFYTLTRDIENYLNDHMIAQAGKIIYYKLHEVFKEYLNIVDMPNYCLLKTLIKEYTKLLSLYTPFIAEEIWHEVLKNDSYIALEKWPEKDPKYVDHYLIDVSNYAYDLIEDIKDIIKILKNKGLKKVILVYPEEWKWNIISKVVDKSTVNMRDIMNLGLKYNIDRRSLSEFGKFVIREWHGRYMKYRRLLKNWKYIDEKIFLVKYFRNFFRKDFPDYILEVYSEVDYRNKYGSLRKSPYPLHPSILLS